MNRLVISLSILLLLTAVAADPGITWRHPNVVVKELPVSDQRPAPAFDVRIYMQDMFPIHVNFSFAEVLPEDTLRPEYDVFQFTTGEQVGHFSKDHRFLIDLNTWDHIRWKVFPSEE